MGRRRSALQEVGNIVISAAAGGLASRSGGVVIPSVPRLRYARSGGLPLEDGLEADRRLTYVLETELIEPNGNLRLRLLWMLY